MSTTVRFPLPKLMQLRSALQTAHDAAPQHSELRRELRASLIAIDVWFNEVIEVEVTETATTTTTEMSA